MPYIKQQDREPFAKCLDELIANLIIENKKDFKDGELNYCISKVINTLFELNPSYATINKIIGVLECAKQEFYVVKAIEYERIKMLQNGVV